MDTSVRPPLFDNLDYGILHHIFGRRGAKTKEASSQGKLGPKKGARAKEKENKAKKIPLLGYQMNIGLSRNIPRLKGHIEFLLVSIYFFLSFLVKFSKNPGGRGKKKLLFLKIGKIPIGGSVIQVIRIKRPKVSFEN